jgi:altronate hydrolase
VKLATNTPLFLKMTGDMDLNCGEIVDGSVSVQELGERIFQLMLETASGKRSKSELLGYGQDEFAPWIIGATM